MKYRQFVWSDPAVQELAASFVAAADEVNVVLWQRGAPEREFFQAVGAKGHYGKPWQGVYMATPSGVFLGSTNQRDPKVVADLLRKALEAYKGMDKAERLRTSAPGPSGDGPTRLYPADGLALRLYARDLPRADGSDQKGYWVGAWNSDVAWFTKDEAKSMVPTSGTKAVDDKLVRRLVKYHLLDNVRGETRRFEDAQVKRAELAFTVTRTEGDLVHLKIEGSSLTEETGEFTRGFDAKILGRATWNGEKFTAFEMLAVGTRWGEASLTGARQSDLGRNPMAIAFQLNDDKVPPAQLIMDLGAKYFAR